MHSCLATQRTKISTTEAMRLICKQIEIDVMLHWHLTRVNGKNFASAGPVGHTYSYFAIKTSRSAQRRIKSIRAVGRCNQQNRTAI
ncbi:hypothetical protein GCM10011363_44870 [Marivita lacus]|uniref:RadC-like JAB domain-containing protein n=1 Tax=Marivita lacus TaxID=1323742 RepID=A0ABQ1LJ32_9RHOB|nr:hypothetical protein GCM10011363_44870 [Marivita lacus]